MFDFRARFVRSVLSVGSAFVLTISLAPAAASAVPPAVPAAVPAAPAAQSAPLRLPNKSIKHTEQNWAWFAPRRWIASSGVYGINISSPDGQMVVDYGFTSILCASATTEAGSVTAYYAQQRAALRQSLNNNLNRVAMQTSRIRQLPIADYGQQYYRQIVEYSGRSGGVGYRGEAIYDYSLASGPMYCYSRNQSRTAPAQGFNTSIRQLRSVQGALAYFGPGVPNGGGNTDPDL